MKLKSLAMPLCLVALCLIVVSAVMADDWNRETVVTFSQPFEVPGVGAQILPAGTYVFKIFDSLSDRHIVQIFNQDKTHIYTTILAIPNYRLKATDKTVITFRERPAGQPEALRAWFYPGREWGEEFVYAKPRAIELAKETNVAVLSTPIELGTAPVEALKTAPVEIVTPQGDAVEMAKVAEAPPAAANEPMMMAEEKLPSTASSLPLIALFGFLAIGAASALLALSKRPARAYQKIG